MSIIRPGQKALGTANVVQSALSTSHLAQTALSTTHLVPSALSTTHLVQSHDSPAITMHHGFDFLASPLASCVVKPLPSRMVPWIDHGPSSIVDEPLPSTSVVIVDEPLPSTSVVYAMGAKPLPTTSTVYAMDAEPMPTTIIYAMDAHQQRDPVKLSGGKDALDETGSTVSTATGNSTPNQTDSPRSNDSTATVNSTPERELRAKVDFVPDGNLPSEAPARSNDPTIPWFRTQEQGSACRPVFTRKLLETAC